MAAPSAPVPSVDASYLRRLLERQPACLIRVRLDGVLLACNDAALGLFGVGALRAILRTNLTDRIVAAERTKWQEFITRCWANGAASLECHLVIPDDDARSVLVQGVALKDHPDGVDSLLLNLRDQSQTRRLEHSIQSAGIDRVGYEERQRAARYQVEQAIAERLKLAALADEHQAERQRLTAALEAQTADRQRREAKFVELEKRVQESQLVLLDREREHRDRVAALETALAAAHAAQVTGAAGRDKHPTQIEQQDSASVERNRQELEAVKLHLQASTAEQARLQALVAEYEVDRKRIAAEHHAAVDTLERSLARAGEEAALGREQSRQALAGLRSQLAQALAEQSRMAARAEEHEHELDLIRAEHHQALADLEASKRLALAELRSQLSQASAEQSRLAARVEEQERERDRLIAEHHRALADVETSKRVAVAELRSQLAQMSAEQSRLVARVEEQERERDLMRVEHHRALADLEASKRLALAQLRSQLAQTSAEQSRLAARVEEQERERDRLIADVETSKRVAAAELRLQLAQTSAERSRLGALVEEHDRERDRLIAEHHRALADLETSKREALAELRSQLSHAFADQRRLAARADEQELERDRMSAEHYRAFADLETRKRDALAELRSQLSQTAAENRLLAARAEEHERERERMSAEHHQATADLQASKQEALTELRAQLSQAAAEHSRLTALCEEHDRQGREAVAECERVLIEVQQALLVRDGSRVEIERRLIDGIDEGARTKADGERLAGLQGGLTLALSEMQAVLNDGQALKQPFEAEHDGLERSSTETIDKATAEKADRKRLTDVGVGLTPVVSEMQTVMTDVEPPHELFGAADDIFVRHLLEGIGEPALREDRTDPPVGSAQAVSEAQTQTTGDEPLGDVFDAEDDAFVRSLMERTPVAAPEGADDERSTDMPEGPTQAVVEPQTGLADGEPLQELPETPPSPPRDS
jgi:hypothetical protein